MPKLRGKKQNTHSVFIIHHHEPSAFTLGKVRHLLNQFVPDGRPYEIQHLAEGTQVEGHCILVNEPPKDAKWGVVAEVIARLYGGEIYFSLDVEAAAEINQALGHFIEKFLNSTPEEEDSDEKPPEFYRFTKEGLMAHDERVIDQALADLLQRMEHPTHEIVKITKKIVEEAMDEEGFEIK